MPHRPPEPDTLSLPTRPSIAVLPFVNMSGDAEQEFFADGIAEDITTGLSRLRWLFVIARNSSFTFQGRNVDVREVGLELGVRYVLEGSMRTSGRSATTALARMSWQSRTRSPRASLAASSPRSMAPSTSARGESRRRTSTRGKPWRCGTRLTEARRRVRVVVCSVFARANGRAQQT